MGETRPFAEARPDAKPEPQVPAEVQVPRTAISPSAAGSPANVPSTNPTFTASGSPRAGKGTLAGRQLGHFLVERLIAEGGMGEVYVGFDLALSRPVAIKVVRADLAQDERFLGVFLREAQAQANVVHNHVLQAYYVGEADGIWFLAMQIVDGGSLEDRLASGEPLPWKEAARHMAAVTAGMAEAARLGIVHRDIKPANILIDRYGDAHVADFGLATSSGILPEKMGEKAKGPNTRKPGSTYPGAVMGTPEFMPPEQLEGKPLDERADIYAIGATFYQLISGKLPHAINSIDDAFKVHKGPGPQPLRKLRPEVPKAFAALIDRCLASDIAKRPASLKELGELLRKVGPRPEVKPSPVVRALSLALDLLPFGAVLPLTYLRAPWAPFAALMISLLWGLGMLSATPGQWLMRLWLRSEGGGDVAFSMAALRSVLQLGWLLPAAYGFSFVYTGSHLAVPALAVGAGWGALSFAGSLLALGPTGQAVHDRLTRTRVLVATG